MDRDRMNPKLIFGSIIGLLLFIILLQNTDVITVKFVFWKISMSRIILLPLVLLIGFIAGFIAGKKTSDF